MHANEAGGETHTNGVSMMTVHSNLLKLLLFSTACTACTVVSITYDRRDYVQSSTYVRTAQYSTGQDTYTQENGQ